MNLSTRLLGYVETAKLTRFSILKGLSGTTDNSLRVVLNRLVKQGRIYNPARGVYAAKDADPFWVATAIFPGYISLSSAFYLNSLIDEYPFTLFVASQVRESIRMGGQEFLYFKARNYIGVVDGRYRVACVEKAICDSLHHLDLVGAPVLARVLYHAGIDYGKFAAISSGESSAFFQRLGYLLSILPSLSADKRRLAALCAERRKANAYLQGRGRGNYVKEWKLIDNIGKEVLLAWQHQ